MSNVYELLYMIRMRDEDASRMLVEEMMPYINYEISRVVSGYKPVKLYEDDLCQEANMCLGIAIEMYREDRNCSFRTYLQLIVRRKIWSQVRMLNHRITIGFNDTVELDDTAVSDESLVSRIENRTLMNDPEYYLHFTEASEQILRFKNSLKKREEPIFYSCLSDRSKEEERERLGLTYKQYEGRIRRMRNRIREAVQVK